MVDWGRRTSWRRAAAPTSTPSRVNETIDGRSTCPSRSGMTLGRPVLSSTYATRLLVVPRSMPTMRDIPLLRASQCVVDDRTQIRADRERFLEGGERTGALGRPGRVPRLAQRAQQARLFLLIARAEPVPLRGQRLPRAAVQLAGRFRLLERFLDLEHLLEQLRRRLRLHRGALARVAALLEAYQVLDPRERLAQRPVRGVEARRGLEDLRLALGRRPLMEIGVAASRELVELALQLGRVDGEPSRQSEDLEVIHPLLAHQHLYWRGSARR